ncbi:LOW QUALITY PROTEIN: insulin-like receptor [Paramacrobiotus metropolitanus]|uniref:LOW QUALITY PROTEIN: insulin-like receptor n=1 Tax=Paramacrobiotus metropolitanus TaxID=2943436 RepID=UPI002445B649|nr:LOW QUALITY PROTEIN: insulin-like receptor [Paramacrobiotus metropolitanus]
MLIVDPIRPLALLCLLLVSGLDAARGGQGAQGDGSVEDEMRRFIRQAVTPTTRKTVLRQAPPPTDPPRLANEKVCGSIDINTEVDTLVTLLSRCTVLEGYLSIVPFDDASTSWENVSFPLLREVTDYVLLYRVTGVKSLQALFPNLAVIRGRSMARDYSLVLFENMDLENVGLVALVSIQRGGAGQYPAGRGVHLAERAAVPRAHGGLVQGGV